MDSQQMEIDVPSNEEEVVLLYVEDDGQTRVVNANEEYIVPDYEAQTANIQSEHNVVSEQAVITEHDIVDQGVIIEHVEADQIDTDQDIQIEDSYETEDFVLPEDDQNENWSEKETKQLLTFYIRNHKEFEKPNVNISLWEVACRALNGKTAENCEKQFRKIIEKFKLVASDESKIDYSISPYFDLCRKILKNLTTVKVTPRVVTKVQSFYHSDNKPRIKIPEHIQSKIASPVKAKEVSEIIIVKSLDSVKGMTPINTVNLPNQIEYKIVSPPEVKIKTESPFYSPKSKLSDEKTRKILELYLQYRNRNPLLTDAEIFKEMATILGDGNANNLLDKYKALKTVYTQMVEKRRNAGDIEVTWPYMAIFDKIIAVQNEQSKLKRTVKTELSSPIKKIKTEIIEPNDININVLNQNDLDWVQSELVILAKFYYDSLRDFHDPSIPDKFLWTQIGRILDKDPKDCSKKIYELKENYSIDLNTAHKDALSILVEKIIDTEEKRHKPFTGIDIKMLKNNLLSLIEIDLMVEYYLENLYKFTAEDASEMQLWQRFGNTVNQTAKTCYQQWGHLEKFYKKLLEQREDNPKAKIDWRHMEAFDRIHEVLEQKKTRKKDTPKTSLKRYFHKTQEKTNKLAWNEKLEEKLLKTYINLLNQGENPNIMAFWVNLGENLKKPATECRQLFNMLKKQSLKSNSAHYELLKEILNASKNGDFDETENMLSLEILNFCIEKQFDPNMKPRVWDWDELAKKIGVDSKCCSKKYSTLKDVYLEQLKIFCSNEEVTWEFFKKAQIVFGFESMVKKLGFSMDNIDNWDDSEIEKLVEFYGDNFDEIENKNDKIYQSLALELSKTEEECENKLSKLKNAFIELTKSKSKQKKWIFYEQLKTIFERNNFELVSKEENEMATEKIVDNIEDVSIKVFDPKNAAVSLDQDLLEQEDVEYILVVPEANEEGSSSKIRKIQVAKTPKKHDNSKHQEQWTRQRKLKLLRSYLTYLRNHKNLPIDGGQMWAEISEEIGKTQMSCKTTYSELKKIYYQSGKNEFANLFKAIINLEGKSEFLNKSDEKLTEQQERQILEYYLENLIEFRSPRYYIAFAFKDLGKAVGVSHQKCINTLKNLEKNYLMDPDNSPYKDIFEKVTEKEEFIKKILQSDEDLVVKNQELTVAASPFWSDEETENMLNYFIENFDKFTNKKFVPKYLWLDNCHILNKTPRICSKRMRELESMYGSKVENPDELSNWKWYEHCKVIFGGESV